MHAVVVKVRITDEADSAETTSQLRDELVPRVAGMPGFVAGYWVRLEGADQGTSVVVFDSEDAARSMKDQIQTAPGVRLESADVGEVVAQA
jgi:heme-degrading monooxygenase HmoA